MHHVIMVFIPHTFEFSNLICQKGGKIFYKSSSDRKESPVSELHNNYMDVTTSSIMGDCSCREWQGNVVIRDVTVGVKM